MDVAGFRAAFPAFTAELFPDARVTFWLSIASTRLPAERWGDLLEPGLCLFVAHHLTLERAASLDPTGVGAMTVAAGPVTSDSKTVGPVSKSKGYSPGAASRIEAGQWNATMYGQQFFDLVQIVGAGGMVT